MGAIAALYLYYDKGSLLLIVIMLNKLSLPVIRFVVSKCVRTRKEPEYVSF